MIGCLTETTTCVVAKPLVSVKLLWLNKDIFQNLINPFYSCTVRFQVLSKVFFKGLTIFYLFYKRFYCLKVDGNSNDNKVLFLWNKSYKLN